MSLQAIVEKIKIDAQSEVQAINAEAEHRLADVTQETNRQINDIKSVFATSFEKQKTQLEVVHKSLEKQRVNMAMQSTKRRVLDEVYKQAFEEISNLPSSEYVEVLVKKYKVLVPNDAKIVSILTSENRQAETEEICKSLSWSAPVTFSSKLKGGCILIGDDFEFDLSIERLFAEQRSESEIEIAATLFNKAI